jgi:hypothetical protein
MSRRKVYIINRSGHDYSSAEHFGDFVFLSDGRMHPFGVSRMYRNFSELLRHSDANDLLLLTSLTHANVIAAAIFAHLHGRLNLLLWTGKGYVKRDILLDELLTTYPSESEEDA